MNDSELTARLERLPRRIDPPQDLWPAIEEGLAEPVPAPRRRSWQPVAVAAAMALAIGATLWTGSGTAPDELIVESAPAMPAGQAYANSVELMYSGALRTLAGEFPEPPAALETGEIELSLRTIQRATEDIREALAEDPESIYLAELLESTHRKRVQMLRAVALTGVAESDDGRRI